MMETSAPQIIIQILIALGTLAVAILAIWGKKFINLLAGPKLVFSLHNARGDLTVRQNGKRTIYYHVKIENKRRWATANRVRVLWAGIDKKAGNGPFEKQPLIIPLQLTWAFPSFHELLPNIRSNDICDLGFLDEGDDKFKLSVYLEPNNFSGFIHRGEAMRIGLKISADNFSSREPYVLEISWDGEWSSDLDEMQRHLVIREIPLRDNGKGQEVKH